MQQKVHRQTWTAYILNKHGEIPESKEAECSDDCIRLELRLLGAFALPNIELTGVIDPYAIVHVAGAEQRTQSISNTTNPEWNSVMVFPIMVKADDAPIQASLEIWDENYTSNTKICSAVFEIPGMGRDSSATMFHQLRTVNLKTPSGSDGGMLRYSAKITSVKRLERRLEALDVLAQVPLLPFAMKCVLQVRDEVFDISGLLREHLRARSLVQSAITLCTMPYVIAINLARSVVKKLIGVFI